MKKLYSLIKNHKYPLLLVLLPLIFFIQVILNPHSMFFPSHDIVSIFSQEKDLFQDSVKTYKSIPLWNPYIFSGSPFLGNPTSSMFYPLNILFLIFPTDNVFGYMYILDSFLIGFFTYLFAKSIKLDNFSSFISAVTIMFSGPMLTLIFPGHLVNFDAFIWFPLILLIYEKAIKKQKIIYGISAAFPIALTLLAGASQIAAFSLLSAFIYFTLRAITNLPKINKFQYLKKLFVIFLLSIGIGFLLSSVQILPTNEFSKLSARSNGLSYDFASDFSLHPKQIISFVLPYFFGNPANSTYWGKGNFWSLNGYVGTLPLLLALIVLTIKPRRLTIIFFILGIFALLFSFGKYSFIFPFFYKYVPQFNSFRAPARFLYVYAFSLAMLAGIGTSILIQKAFLLKKYLSKISVLIFLTTILGFTISIFLSSRNIGFYEKYILNNSYAVGIKHSILYSQLIQDILIFSLILLTFSVILFLKNRNKININVLKVLFTVIILFDLWTFNSKIISLKKTDEIYNTPDFINKIKKDKDVFRIFDREGLYLPITERNKIENITGVHSLYIKDYRDFVWAVGPHENKPYESFFEIKNIKYPMFLDLLNVKYIISNGKVWENTNFLPRAYIVPNAIIVSKDSIINKLKEGNFDPKKQIILAKKPDVRLTNSSSFKKIKILHREPNRIRLKTSLEEPGFLVLSEIYYPGWKAFDNGRELEIYNADYILRSIYLKSGNHNISFIYEADSYRIGKIISLLTIFSVLFYLFYENNKRVY